MIAKSTPTKEILTVEETASLLKVSPSTVRNLARRGLLPGRKVGKEWRFTRSAVLAWVSGDAPPSQLRQV